MQRWADMTEPDTVLQRTTEESVTPVTMVMESDDERTFTVVESLESEPMVSPKNPETRQMKSPTTVQDSYDGILKVALQQGPPPIDFTRTTDGDLPPPVKFSRTTGTTQPVEKKTEGEKQYTVLKKELHHILNCFQLKDRNPASLCVHDNLKDPRFNKVTDYMHTLKGKMSYAPELRRSIGKPSEPVSKECRDRFKILKQNLLAIVQRIDNVLDFEDQKIIE